MPPCTRSPVVTTDWLCGTDAQFYGVNLFCELDAEGEYWIDTEKALLYFMQPGGSPGAADAFLSLSTNVITLSSTAAPLQHVVLEGFGVHFARGTGISLQSAANVTIANVNASNHGHSGECVDVSLLQGRLWLLAAPRG